MKNRTSLIALALLASLLTGCFRHPSAGTNNFTELGVVKASDGVPSRHVLADGRICVITPTFFSDGKAKLSLTANWTNSSGTTHYSRPLETQIVADRTTILSMGNDILLSLTLHESK
jgi:hypothetical protein